jgi:hypothetical protein
MTIYHTLFYIYGAIQATLYWHSFVDVHWGTIFLVMSSIFFLTALVVEGENE